MLLDQLLSYLFHKNGQRPLFCEFIMQQLFISNIRLNIPKFKMIRRYPSISELTSFSSRSACADFSRDCRKDIQTWII